MRSFKWFISVVSICFIVSFAGVVCFASEEIQVPDPTSFLEIVPGVSNLRRGLSQVKQACSIILSRVRGEQRAQLNLKIESADADELKYLADSLTAFWPDSATLGSKGFLELNQHALPARRIFEEKLKDIFTSVREKKGIYCQYWYEWAGVYSYACSRSYIATQDFVNRVLAQKANDASSRGSEILSILSALVTREELVVLVPNGDLIGKVIEIFSATFLDPRNHHENFIIQQIKETPYKDGGRGYRLVIKKLEGLR